MAKVLISRNVFIDASYFRSILFDVSSSTMDKFKTLCQSDEFILFTTSITKREINNTIEKYSEELFGYLRNFRQKGRVLDIIKQKTDGRSLNDIKLKDIRAELQEKIDTFYNDCKVQEIDIPDNSVSSVFDLYFNKKKPFGDKKKKSEFPDAFVFYSLLNFLEIKNTSIYVVSTDGDFADACNDCEVAEHINSIAKILDIYYSHERISNWLYTRIEAGMENIEDKIIEKFEYLGFYIDDFDGDVEDVSVDEINVEETLIINLEESEAIVMLPVKITFTAKVTFDDPENGIYDSEDKVWISFGTLNKDIYKTINTDAELRILIDDEEDLFEILEIVANSNKDIGISVDPYGY